MILRLLAITALALAVSTIPAEAAKGNKANKGAGKGDRMLSRFDADHNGTIDGEEVARLQATYAALYALDTDHNGTISEAEAAAAKIPVRKGAGAGKGGKRAGKNGAVPAPTSTTPSTPAPVKAQ